MAVDVVDMNRCIARTLGTAALALLLGACAGGRTATNCNDGTDNDGDGLIDAADPGCAKNANRDESPDPPACQNGLDDDSDGLTDDADWGCEDREDFDEVDPLRACNDGDDNDGDGLIDFPEDDGCESPVEDDEDVVHLCEDFLDNDGDGIMDFPFEPGCASADDDDETDPEPLPACSNGGDDDLDERIDYPTDPGCESAGDDDEANVLDGVCGPMVEVRDLTATGTILASVAVALPDTLSSPSCGGRGGERAYAFTVTAGMRALLATTDHAETTLDTVIYLRASCTRAESELGCDDDSGVLGTGSASTLLIPEVAPGTYFVVVDAFGPGSLGDYRLTIEARLPLHAPCSAPPACAPGLVCRELTPGAPVTCEPHVCADGGDNDGDGIVDFPFEPGCVSPDDDDEADPSPRPACGNRVDDDGDGAVDFPADPGCAYASDDQEVNECGAGLLIQTLDAASGATGTTSGATLARGSCGGTDAPEAVHAFLAPFPLLAATVAVDATATTFDSVLYVRNADCTGGVELACNNDASPFSTAARVTFVPTVGVPVYLFIDGTFGAAGDYLLVVSGLVAAGATCDPALPRFACVEGTVCGQLTPGVHACVLAACGDGEDDDGDGRIDFPLDPGCDAASDDDETDPVVLAACANGLDDDGDAHVDFPADAGCDSASDDNEFDECTPGVPVLAHPGGAVAGDTISGTYAYSAPASCDPFGTTGTSPELVYSFQLTRPVTRLTLDTAGSSFDTVIYVRAGDCAAAGPDGWCNDDVDLVTTTSLLSLTAPALGFYYVVVDGIWSSAGSFVFTIVGELGAGASCTPGEAAYVCGPGLVCEGGACATSACANGVDDDGDGLADVADPGCDAVTDDDEADPAASPACANGADDDGDGLTDYPADPGCTRAADATEENCVHDVCTARVALVPGCDPCATLLCAGDLYCCSTVWDAFCVTEVALFCGFSCS